MSALAERLIAALERGEAPGGAVGLWYDGATDMAASGWANRSAAIEADADTLFPVGSIAKAYTATLVMQLVDRGQVELDAPIGNWLSDFHPDAPVSIRQLLCHASGIDGDLLTDFGRDTDAVAQLANAAQAAEQLHPPGAFFSYCNLGYILLGRLLEVVHGATWDEVLRTKLLDPLGLHRTVTLPDDALKHRYAVGEGGRPFFPRSNGPSGTTMAASVGDLIRFARMHLDGGVTEDGVRILSEAAVREMRTLQIEAPGGGRYHGWGLGWMLIGQDGAFGHDGGVEGACAFLRIWPNDRRILALMVNRSNAIGIWRELSGEAAPEAPTGSAVDVDPDRYVGRYARHGQTIDVSPGDGDLAARLRGDYAGEGMTFRLRPVAPDRFAVLAEGLTPVPAHFLPHVGDSPLYLHVGDRIFRREGEA